MTFRVPLGYHKESKTYISPVSASRTEKYFCPKCQIALILKDGPINIKHFAHKNTECTYDSVIHALAQQIILGNTNILLEELPVQYTNPRKEVIVGQRRADAIIDTEDYPGLLIEITVTHPLIDDKLKEYENYNVLEIDLSELQIVPDMDTLRDLVLYNSDNRTLLRGEPVKTVVDSDIDQVIFGGIVIALALSVAYSLKRLYHRFKW